MCENFDIAGVVDAINQNQVRGPANRNNNFVACCPRTGSLWHGDWRNPDLGRRFGSETSPNHWASVMKDQLVVNHIRFSPITTKEQNGNEYIDIPPSVIGSNGRKSFLLFKLSLFVHPNNLNRFEAYGNLPEKIIEKIRSLNIN